MGVAFASKVGGATLKGSVELKLYKVTNPASAPTSGITQLNTSSVSASTMNVAAKTTSFNSMLAANSTFMLELKPVADGADVFNGECITLWVTYSSDVFSL